MPPSIQFNTAHNVNINVRLATIWQRIAACIIDNVIKVVLGLGLIYVIFSFLGSDTANYLGFFSLLILPFFFYSLLFEKFYDGQTPGKKAMNIKVVSIDGVPVTTGQYLIRWLFRLIDINMLSGVIAILGIAIGGKGQRIGDMVAGTTVIDTFEQPLNRIDRFQDLDRSYLPRYPEAKQLQAKETRLIKEVLSDNSERRFDLILQLSDKIQSELHIVKEHSSEEFLNRLLKDNQYYQTIYLENDDKDSFV